MLKRDRFIRCTTSSPIMLLHTFTSSPSASTPDRLLCPSTCSYKRSPPAALSRSSARLSLTLRLPSGDTSSSGAWFRRSLSLPADCPLNGTAIATMSCTCARSGASEDDAFASARTTLRATTVETSAGRQYYACFYGRALPNPRAHSHRAHSHRAMAERTAEQNDCRSLLCCSTSRSTKK